MRFRLLLLLLVILALSEFRVFPNNPVPKAKKGILDLRELPHPENFITTLTGEWEFYWKKILRPFDFKSGTVKPDYYGEVPSYWTDYPEKLIKTEKYGYATYRLLVLLPAGYKNELGLDMPVFDSSYDLYINGKYMGGNGNTGKTAAESKPEYKRNLIRFNPVSDSLSIIINVANFYHRRGGFWLPVRMGTSTIMHKSLRNNQSLQWSAIGLLFGFFIFFLIFYILDREEKKSGFFSMTLIGLALRPLFTDYYLILNFITIDWNWIVRFEYLGLFLILIGWTWFVSYLYPSPVIKIISWIITVFFFMALVASLLLPVRIFTYSMLAYYPSIGVLSVYFLYRSIIGASKKIITDFIYLLAYLMLLAGALHDILVSLGRSGSLAGYLFSYVIILFVFVTATSLLYKWIKAYKEKGRLQKELTYINSNLELLVNQRTQELISRNEEIEKQNTRIALQNKHLSDSIQLKNKIFSVISHDLRSPVVNILYMLNLLKEKEFKEKYDTFANSCIQYAQMVINLLENMLVWGRGQEDKIKFSPGRHDLTDIILTNLSIFKENADSKGISVNFTQTGSSIAFVDKDLLDMIIRNILSNAVKYTPRGGRISILLRDKTSNGNGIMLKFCDNGIGIPEEKQKDLFTSAEIESTPGTENEKGTGLGLKLCHELVKINNGTITVESKLGEGTCIIIILPA
jgi:signal transduction histidine kinase